MPKIYFDTRDAFPEGLREIATEENGKFVVDVVPQAKLAEFRDNNIAISKERDTLKTQVGDYAKLVGEDFKAFETEVTELRTIAQQVKDGKLKGTGDVEAEVTRRVTTMKGDFERQLQEKANEVNTWKTKAAETDQKFRRSQIDRAVTDAVLNDKSGAIPSALPDILMRAYGVFVVGDDGKLTAKDGEAVIYGSDGATPISPLEWLGSLREKAPHFFKGSSGGGASGTQNGKGYGSLTKEEFMKMPPQQRLEYARKHGIA